MPSGQLKTTFAVYDLPHPIPLPPFSCKLKFYIFG